MVESKLSVKSFEHGTIRFDVEADGPVLFRVLFTGRAAGASGHGFGTGTVASNPIPRFYYAADVETPDSRCSRGHSSLASRFGLIISTAD